VKLAAVGAFDGLHRGHMKVINAAGPHAGVVFFEPVPRQVFGGLAWKNRLTTPAERYELLRDKGINSIITVPFDGQTVATAPLEFGRLLAQIGLFNGYVVGYDFRFGSDASGTAVALRESLECFGLTVTVVESENFQGVPVKSGKIRELLLGGDLSGASNLLGRAYRATGVVSRGRGFGRTIGFPTLNVRVPECKLLPPRGSYATFAGIGCRSFKAVSFVVPERNLIEVHVPSFEGDFYGAAVSVEFISFIRKSEQFKSHEMLRKQIKNDLERSMEVLREWQ
jgi:riboflavin kinase/FMN adenylyltransferase